MNVTKNLKENLKFKLSLETHRIDTTIKFNKNIHAVPSYMHCSKSLTFTFCDLRINYVEALYQLCPIFTWVTCTNCCTRRYTRMSSRCDHFRRDQPRRRGNEYGVLPRFYATITHARGATFPGQI